MFHLSIALPVSASLAIAVATPALAQRPTPRDSSVRDSSTVVERGMRLAPLEVRASIVPSTGVAIGSGIPARVARLDGKAIDAWEPRLLSDALGAHPGVSIYDDLGTPWKLNVTMRGFAAGPTVGTPPGMSVFLDGVRQNEPAAQEVNFDLLPLEHVTRVELLSGSASLLGPNSLGGAINLITDRGGGAALGELELSGGSFGQWGAEVSGRGRLRDRVDWYAGAGHEREGGWRRETGGRLTNAFANVTRGDDRRALSLQAFGSRSRAATAGSLPESLFGVSPRANFTAGDFEDLDLVQLSVSGVVPLGIGRGGLTAYARRSSAERFNVNQSPDPDVRGRTANATLGATADWRTVLAVGAATLGLRAGLDAAASRVRARIYTEAPNAAAATRTLTTDVKSPSVDLAGYILGDLRAGSLTLSAGGRYDAVRIPFQNQVRVADNTTNRFRNFSPRLGASLAVARGVALHASVGRSFRAPAILELGCADPEATCPLPFALGDDPPLAPVRATTVEVGSEVTRGGLTVTASAYHTDVRDEIFFVASEVAVFSGYFANLARTRRIGFELALNGSALRERLVWHGSWAATRATFRSAAALFSIRGDDDFAGTPLAGENDVEPGDRLPLVPDVTLKGGALLRLPAGLSLGLDVRHTGRQWLRGDEANVTAPLPSYSVASARLGVERAGWEFALVATNLLDRRAATFGTFNENRVTGALERFLTPLHARALKFVVRREIVG